MRGSVDDLPGCEGNRPARVSLSEDMPPTFVWTRIVVKFPGSNVVSSDLPAQDLGELAKPKSKRKLFIPRGEIRRGKTPCDHCTGKCCRYFSLPIDTPTEWDDFDSIRWYLAHQKTMVYVEKGVWYLVVMTKCNYLLDDNRCAIYFERPRICREYTTDECEYDADWSFEKVFETPEQIWDYADAVLPPKRKKKSPITKPGGGLVVLH